MSEPAEGARPEGIAGVLGVGFLLLLLVGGALGAALARTESLDAQQQFATWFAPGALPFDLAPVDAARQPSGEILLRLAAADAPEEAPRKKLDPALKKSAGSKGGMLQYDWGAVPIGAEGTPPREALFTTWPLKSARKQIRALFERSASGNTGNLRERSRGIDPLAGLGPEGGRRVLAVGRLPWGEFEAPFVHERHFEAGGTFVDSVRVNLSLETEALVLFLRWPRGLPASTQRAEEFLAALRR